MSGEMIPYGLRDVKITPLAADGKTTVGSPIDLPAAQTFSFTEAEEFEELRGDDKLVTVVGKGANVEWELGAGGLSIPAVKAAVGGTVTESGVEPETTITWDKKSTDARPFFRVEGQVITDGGGDLHCILPRCRATSEFSGSFEEGSFFITSLSGTGLGSLATGEEDLIYRFVRNSTATAIPAT